MAVLKKTRAKNTKNHAKKVLLVEQELKLARILAGNNKTLRDRTLKRLKKWFGARESSLPFSEDDLLRIWKGLFYYMWMSDKPLVQEECAENISQLCHFNSQVTSLLFFKSFLRTMCNEWFGIDQLRLDKFLMLVRRVLRQSFQVLNKSDWSEDLIDYFNEILSDTVLNVGNNVPLGLNMHVTDIYLEELAKVCRGKTTCEQVVNLLKPFAQLLAKTRDARQADNITKNVFRYLMEQSDVGIEYKEKFNAWREQGFPGGSIDKLTKLEVDVDKNAQEDDSDLDQEQEQPKDPRAGKVDVLLPQVRFDGNQVADMLLSLRFHPDTNVASRKRLNRLADEFRAVSRGTFPLGVKRVTTDAGRSTDLKKSVRRLQRFESRIAAGQSTKARQKVLKRKKVKQMVRAELQKYAPADTRKQKRKCSESLDAFIAESEADLPPVKLGKKTRRSSGTWQIDEITPVQLHVSRNSKRHSIAEMDTTKAVTRSANLAKTPARKLKRRHTDVVRNPFCSAKKVEISNVEHYKLSDYHKRLVDSPGIPFDANKKPSKGLLKPGSMPSPINPFYKRKLNL